VVAYEVKPVGVVRKLIVPTLDGISMYLFDGAL
jgi:hypothetical protein